MPRIDRRKPSAKKADRKHPKQPATRPAKRKATRRNPKADSKAKRPKATKKPQPKAKQKKPAVMGRPSLYSEEIGNRICERVMAGESLRQILLLPGMPDSRNTVFRWLAENADFRDNWTAAKKIQADAFAEELLDIADNSLNDWVTRENERSGEVKVVLNDDAIQRAKLRIETRKWAMSRFAPKKYGDKLDLEHSGKVDTGVTLDEATRIALIERRRKALAEDAAEESEETAPA